MATRELSGPAWVARFPGSRDPDACVDPFRAGLQTFIAALKDAGASVDIAATFRPPERAYLMHWSWKIAKSIELPQNAAQMSGVEIEWVHPDAAGQPDIPRSRSAALQMVAHYGLVTQPALHSRHTEGRAIDMTIRWAGALKIKSEDGSSVTIDSTPHTGMNTDLAKVGATYGVIKAAFANDEPHWSVDGH